MEEQSPRADSRESKRAARHARIPGLARVVVFLCAAASLSAAAAPPSSERPDPSEYQIKAAFLYNFAKFVDWPPDATADARPVIIGVLGDDPFGRTLDDTVHAKTVNGRGLVVKRFSTLHELAPCQILFVSTSLTHRLPEILSRIQGSPTLTISEGERFAKEGGMVRLLTEDNKVRFEINVDATELAGLRVSSQLLALARIVHGRQEGGH